MNTSVFYSYLYMYMPSAILVFGAIIVMFSNVFASHFSRNTSLSLCMIFIASSMLFCISVGHINNVSNITLSAEYIILCASFSFMLLTFSKHKFIELQTQEFYPLYLFSIAGFMLMVHGENLILVLLGLEIGSLPLAAILAFNKRLYGIEGGIKYFVSSALASIFFILGIMLFYLYFGSFSLQINFVEYAAILSYGNKIDILLLIFSMLFILAGLGFKVSLVPWHSWMPDIYEASNPMLAGYISVVPKIAGFALFAILFLPIFQSDMQGHNYIGNFAKVLLCITITLPNIMALMQKDVKRMLAFSSISHSGFAIACIYLGSFDTLILYWILFFITNLGAFAMLWMNKPSSYNVRYDYSFQKFYGFGKAHPIMALGMALFMLSLAGIPPFSIFWGKILIVTSALKQGEIALAFIMMFNSAIAVCYYLKLIVAMYFKQGYNQELYIDNSTAPIRCVALICALLCVGSIFVVSYLLKYISILGT